MTFDHDRPYFNLSVAACRRAGAMGGRQSTRNRKLRKTTQVLAVTTEVATETAAEAIALLDAQFPWLRGAERRGAR